MTNLDLSQVKKYFELQEIFKKMVDLNIKKDIRIIWTFNDDDGKRKKYIKYLIQPYNVLKAKNPKDFKWFDTTLSQMTNRELKVINNRTEKELNKYNYLLWA